MGEGKLDIVAEGQTVTEAAASPQQQASFKTGEAAEQVNYYVTYLMQAFPHGCVIRMEVCAPCHVTVSAEST